MRAALAEDDVAGDDELLGGLFGAETFSGALFGFVGAALFGVGGEAEEGCWEVGERLWGAREVWGV